MKSYLVVPAVAGLVHLGCSTQEREVAQAVRARVEIKFKALPPACESDELKDTPCYAQMSSALLSVFQAKHYATIEHLGWESFRTLRSYLGDFRFLEGAKLTVVITKVAPPVDAIVEGSVFSLSDRL